MRKNLKYKPNQMYYFCLADLLGSLGNIVKMSVDEPVTPDQRNRLDNQL